jgi:mannose-6-phosphate isomerase-like protein (cupin superfamily)
MNTSIGALTTGCNTVYGNIFKLLAEPLSNIPFHENTDAITRFVAKGFPVHLAVHQVSPVQSPPLQYTFAHVHEEYDEVNIILSSKSLVYKIQTGTDVYTVTDNTCIFIPKGTVHSANVLSGEGFFITLRIN